MTDTTTIEIPTTLVEEAGYGILGRAQQLHDNPDDTVEDDAEELRALGQELIGYDPSE